MRIGRSWGQWGSHLLVGQGETLPEHLNIIRGIVEEGRSAGIVLEVWGKGRLSPCNDQEAEKPCSSCTIALRVSMRPGTFSTQALEAVPSSKRARSMLFMVRWLRSLTAFPSGW